MKKSLLILSVLFSLNASAITIDSMVKYQKQDANNAYTITNPDPFPVFVQTKLSELVRSDGKSKEVELKAKDFDNWPIYLEPSSIILDPKGKVKVNVVDLYKLMNKKLDKDKIIGVSFIPSSYKKKEDDGKSKSKTEGAVNILMGYKSWYIIPKDGEIHGNASVDYSPNKKSYLVNDTDTAISFRIDACNIKPKPEACKGTVLVLANSKKNLLLPKGKGIVNIVANSLNLKYKKKFDVKL